MNEKRIQDVLEIDRQAQAVHEAALSEAEQLPRKAEQDAQAIIDKAKADAEEEGRQAIARARAGDETERIIAQAEEKARNNENLAMTHFDRTVSYVLARVVGRE